MSSSISKKITSGLFWTFGERILAQGVSFIVSIVLARLLMPEEYGIISMVLVFINIANVFVANGLGESLIQKKNTSSEDFSTIFCCSLFLSVVLYIFLFFLAPVIANFYSNELLAPVIRVLSLKLPLASFNSIQRAYVSKHMIFKKFFFSTLGGTIVSGVVGILLASMGFGVWALVFQYLVNSTMDTLILLITVKWKPSLKFNIQSARELLGFGFRMMISSLLNTVYSELHSLVIGKVYTAQDLGFYKRANQFPNLIITNVCSSVSTVLFPAMSNETNGLEDLKKMTQKSLKLTSYFITPLMIGLIAIAKPLIVLLLTNKWIECVPYMQLLCIAYLFQSIQTANCQAIKAIGRGDIYLKTEVLKKIIGILLLLLMLRKGVLAIVISFIITVMVSSVITMIPNIFLLNYGIYEQILDLLPSFTISILMFVCIFPISYIHISPILVIILQIIAGLIVYLGLSILTKNESFIYLLGKLIKK